MERQSDTSSLNIIAYMCTVLERADSENGIADDAIIQFKRGSQQEFTFATKNGRVRKFFAKIINFFSKRDNDYYDKNNVGNTNRQKLVADMFYKQLSENNEMSQVFNNKTKHLNKITVGEVRALLQPTRSLAEESPHQEPLNILAAHKVGRNDDVPVFINQATVVVNQTQLRRPYLSRQTVQNGSFGNRQYNKECRSAGDIATDMQLAGINDFDDLKQWQKDNLQKVYNHWVDIIAKNSIIRADEYALVLGNLISNSNPLLTNIINKRGCADDYLVQINLVSGKLETFFRQNVLTGVSFEETAKNAFKIMDEFANLANKFGNPEQRTNDLPFLGDYILFPALQAANLILDSVYFSENIARKQGQVLKFLLQTSDAVVKDQSQQPEIGGANYHDKFPDQAINLKPIRCALNFAGFNVRIASQDKMLMQENKAFFIAEAGKFVVRNKGALV